MIQQLLSEEQGQEQSLASQNTAQQEVVKKADLPKAKTAPKVITVQPESTN